MERTRFAAVVAAAAAVLLAACTAVASPASPVNTSTRHPARAYADGDWLTYHHDNARTGNATAVAPLGSLAQAWHAALDGAVYGQPLVVGKRVLAATENDTVYSLDPATGNVGWSTNIGQPEAQSDLPCGDIDPLGITGTMAYDQKTSRVFAVAELNGGTHTLVGLNVNTGKVEVKTPLEPPKGDPIAHQQRAALTVTGGRVYVAYGGLAGDCANYIGSVVSVTTAGADPISYYVPTTREAGIWATGGGVVDGDKLLYAVGNGESTASYDDSDSVLALSQKTLAKADLFAPSTWADDNQQDLDLGSSNPTLVGDHVVAVGKRGTGYVLRHDKLGGVGGQLAEADMCKSFGGSAVNGDVAYLPCTDGPRAVRIAADGTPTVVWHAGANAAGSPTLGGGAVWVADYDGGVLYALDPADGSVKAQLSVGSLPHFASPTLSGNTAYLGTMDGVVAVSGA
jgi:outer membrane protein assembly factor BamB